MSPTSYRTALPRDIGCEPDKYSTGIPPCQEKFSRYLPGRFGRFAATFTQPVPVSLRSPFRYLYAGRFGIFARAVHRRCPDFPPAFPGGPAELTGNAGASMLRDGGLRDGPPGMSGRDGRDVDGRGRRGYRAGRRRHRADRRRRRAGRRRRRAREAGIPGRIPKPPA